MKSWNPTYWKPQCMPLVMGFVVMMITTLPPFSSSLSSHPNSNKSSIQPYSCSYLPTRTCSSHLHDNNSANNNNNNNNRNKRINVWKRNRSMFLRRGSQSPSDDRSGHQDNFFSDPILAQNGTSAIMASTFLHSHADPAVVEDHRRHLFPPSAIPKHDDKHKNDDDAWQARLLLLLSAALYGTNFTMVKSLDECMSVALCSTLRFGFAALSMLPFLFAPTTDDHVHAHVVAHGYNDDDYDDDDNDACNRRHQPPSRLAAGLAGMEIGMWNSVGYIAQAVGLKTSTASKSAFLCSMAMVTVPLFDHYLFGKKMLHRQILGAGIAATGVWALEMTASKDAFALGDMASLIQPFMFGLGFCRMETAMGKYPTEARRLAAAQLLMVFLVSLSYLMTRGDDGDPSSLLAYDSLDGVVLSMNEIASWLQDPVILGMLFWTGVVTTAFTIWMETWALKTLSAAETTLIFSTEPLFGAAFAAVVAGECFGTEAWIGGAFILGGCLISGIDFAPQSKTSLLDLDETKICR